MPFARFRQFSRIAVVIGGMGQLIVLAERLADRSRPAPGHSAAFFFDLSCPFSYLAAERVERLLGDVEWIPAASTLLRRARMGAVARGAPRSREASGRAAPPARLARRLPGVRMLARCGPRHTRPRSGPARGSRWPQADSRSAAASTCPIRRSWPRPRPRPGCRWRNASPPPATPARRDPARDHPGPDRARRARASSRADRPPLARRRTSAGRGRRAGALGAGRWRRRAEVDTLTQWSPRARGDGRLASPVLAGGAACPRAIGTAD